MSPRSKNVRGDADLAISWVDTGQIDFADELDGRWLVWILVAAVHLQGVDSVLVDALEDSQSAFAHISERERSRRTCGGPRIVPFQFDMSRSSPSARPYEQASRIQFSSVQIAAADNSILGVSVPAPSPFSPFSSSSNSLKFLGTLAAMMTV